MLESLAVVVRLAGLAFLITYSICDFAIGGDGCLGVRRGELWCGD